MILLQGAVARGLSYELRSLISSARSDATVARVAWMSAKASCDVSFGNSEKEVMSTSPERLQTWGASQPPLGMIVLCGLDRAYLIRASTSFASSTADLLIYP